MEQIEITNRRCPKCKSKNILLVEIWDGAAITWEQSENGTIDKNDGSLTDGDPTKVEGHCRNCKHMWTFRNAHQINDLFK